MKKIFFGLLSALLYLIGAGGAAVYILASVGGSMLSPTVRMILLCGVALFIYLGSIVIAKKLIPQRKTLIMRCAFRSMFAVYAILVLTFTLFDNYFGRNGFHFIFTAPDDIKGMYTKTSINLIPFKNILWYFVNYFKGNVGTRGFLINMLGNVVAFMPMGLFVPLLIRGCKRFLSFALFTAACIALIECTQIMLLTGFCDIDDLILNLGGACATYGFLHIPRVKKIVETVTGLEY